MDRSSPVKPFPGAQLPNARLGILDLSCLGCLFGSLPLLPTLALPAILALSSLSFLAPTGLAQNAPAQNEALPTKTWSVPLAVLRNGTASAPDSPTTRFKGNGADFDCKEFLCSVGVQFAAPGSNASYSAKNQALTVVNTPEQLGLVGQMVEQWSAQSKQAALLKTIRELGPEEKKRLSENLKQWTSLTADQKQALRHREGLIHKQANEEAASVEKELPEDRREAFRKHYLESRKELEAQLRSEFDQRRKNALKGLLEKVKREYLPPPAEGPK